MLEIDENSLIDDTTWKLLRSAINCNREKDQYVVYAAEYHVNGEALIKLQDYAATLHELYLLYLYCAKVYYNRNYRHFEVIRQELRELRQEVSERRPTIEPTLQGRRSRA
jgi:hypothetical protein